MKFNLLPPVVRAFLANRVFQSFGSMLLGARLFLTYQELALLTTDSNPVYIGGKELMARTTRWIIQNELLPQCTTTVKDLKRVMDNKEISYEKKKLHAKKIFATLTNFNNSDIRQTVIVCLVVVISSLYFSNISGFFALVEALFESKKSGKLSSPISNLIRRMLNRQGIPLNDFDFLE